MKKLSEFKDRVFLFENKKDWNTFLLFIEKNYPQIVWSSGRKPTDLSMPDKKCFLLINNYRMTYSSSTYLSCSNWKDFTGNHFYNLLKKYEI